MEGYIWIYVTLSHHSIHMHPYFSYSPYFPTNNELILLKNVICGLFSGWSDIEHIT